MECQIIPNPKEQEVLKIALKENLKFVQNTENTINKLYNCVEF